MKRFTETTKWSNPWFRRLDPKFKAFWLYLVDSCDVAGVWDSDLELASFQIGEKFEQEEVLGMFEGRISVLKNGKWHLTKFISFQYGTLNPENPCHRGVIKSLLTNEIEAYQKALQRPFKGPKDKDKDKDKTEGEHEGKQLPPELEWETFKEAWERWTEHRRQIKKKLTPEMTKAALKKLATYGPERAIQIINYTIEKGWQGLADEFQVPRSNANGNQIHRAAPPIETV